MYKVPYADSEGDMVNVFFKSKKDHESFHGGWYSRMLEAVSKYDELKIRCAGFEVGYKETDHQNHILSHTNNQLARKTLKLEELIDKTEKALRMFLIDQNVGTNKLGDALNEFREYYESPKGGF